MFPLKDDIPNRSFPFITMSIIVLNLVVFIYQLSLKQKVGGLIHSLGVIPYEITHHIDIYPTISIPIVFTLFTAMFIHGDFLHFLGNMLYLWIFGDNVENSMGHLRFLAFYLICGLIAFYTQIYLHSDSRIPIIGASGAISGILGAYLFLFPYARISTAIILGIIIKIVRIPAVIFLGFWIFIQFLYSASSSSALGVGVAWFSHIGGFIAGFMLVILFKKNHVKFGFLKR